MGETIWHSDLKETKKSCKSSLKTLTRRCSQLILIVMLLAMMYGATQFFMTALGEAIDVEFQARHNQVESLINGGLNEDQNYQHQLAPQAED